VPWWGFDYSWVVWRLHETFLPTPPPRERRILRSFMKCKKGEIV
jgi:hypothetical protein